MPLYKATKVGVKESSSNPSRSAMNARRLYDLMPTNIFASSIARYHAVDSSFIALSMRSQRIRINLSSNISLDMIKLDWSNRATNIEKMLAYATMESLEMQKSIP